MTKRLYKSACQYTQRKEQYNRWLFYGNKKCLQKVAISALAALTSYTSIRIRVRQKEWIPDSPANPTGTVSNWQLNKKLRANHYTIGASDHYGRFKKSDSWLLAAHEASNQLRKMILCQMIFALNSLARRSFEKKTATTTMKRQEKKEKAKMKRKGWKHQHD